MKNERRTSSPQSTETFPYQHHEFLLALIDLFEVVYKLGELNVAVLGQKKGLACLTKELDELSVVARADVCEAGVGGVDVGADGGVQ